MSSMSYAIPMPETAAAIQARQKRRIEQLEKSVVDLREALRLVINEMRSAGIPVSLPNRLKKLVGITADGQEKNGLTVRANASATTSTSVLAETATRANQMAPASSGLASAQSRGEAAKADWVRSGEVVSAKTLSEAWGLTPQALGPAAKRGEVFAVVVSNQRYYPIEFLKLDRNDVGTVCKQLVGMDASEQLIFWKRKHGALGGKTVFEVARSRRNGPQILKVVALAQALTAHMRADAQMRMWNRDCRNSAPAPRSGRRLGTSHPS